MGALNFIFFTLQALLLVPNAYGICSFVPHVPHSKITYGSSFSYYQTACDNGYILSGNRIVLCENGNWNSPTPTCLDGQSTVCEELPPPENGRVECDEKPLSVGKTCRFSCLHGYTLKDNGIRNCMVGRKWSGIATECVTQSTTLCPFPRPLIHGTVVGCSPHNKPKVNDKCDFRCNNGYVLKGPSSLTCTSSGRYVDEEGKENFPECTVPSYRLSNNQNRHKANERGEQKDNDYNPCQDLGCTQICNNKGGRARCSCRGGFNLASDGKSCVEISSVGVQYVPYFDPHRGTHYESGNGNGRDPQHESSNPCDNHQCPQLCRVENGRAQCRCWKGYLLDQADQRTCNRNLGPPVHSQNSCQHNKGGCEQKCQLKRYGIIECGCHPGYYLAPDKKSCIAIAPSRPRVTCDDNNGGCEHHCSQRGYDVQCTCRMGYRVDVDGKRCIDIDECLDERLNSCHHGCLNTEGSYTCHCLPGYVLIENNRCEGCRNHSYWSTEKNGCVDCPANSFTRSEGKSSISDCICLPGFTGSPGDNILCQDIDECASENFGCSHKCVNTPGAAFCSCPVGYAVDNGNKTCIDIDECSVKNGGCDGHCLNTEGSFHCECPEGYVSSNKDQYSCDDVNECLENNGGCHHLCANYRGGHHCTCYEGYQLDSSLKNCTDVSCPALPVPHFSSMICKNKAIRLNESDSYPVGTICTFKCMTGFKDTSEQNKMKCQENGTWKGSLAKCKSQRCPALDVPENGDVHPSSCATNGNTVKQKCTFTCRQGYKLKGLVVFTCRNNLTWNIAANNTPVCEPEEFRASMECTRDMTVTLLPGKSSQAVTIPEPVTNMESYEINPKNISVGIPIEFKAGKTKVVFSTSSQSSNRTAKCITTIHVVDKEPPVFLSCPEPIIIENAKIDGERVTWVEPNVTDNVGVESVKSSVEPNTMLTPGSYAVEYVARDSAGNTAVCSFKIDIIRLICDNLTNPAHGEANCMDWLYGRLCQPLCEDGYIRNPSDPPFYTCGDSGLWEPSRTITDCLPYKEAVSSVCPEGWELKTVNDTDEEICLECPSDAFWSPTTRTCDDTRK